MKFPRSPQHDGDISRMFFLSDWLPPKPDSRESIPIKTPHSIHVWFPLRIQQHMHHLLVKSLRFLTCFDLVAPLFCFAPQDLRSDSPTVSVERYMEAFARNLGQPLELMSLPGGKLRFVPSSPSTRQPYIAGRRRVDFVPLFESMAQTEVKIFHVVVSEDPSRPHSDRAIRESLQMSDT